MYSFTMPRNRVAAYMHGLGMTLTSKSGMTTTGQIPAVLPVVPIAPNLPGTKQGQILPGTAVFGPDEYTTQAAAIEREWNRVSALVIFRPEDKIAAYNTVWNMANALRSKLDTRHPAFPLMTNLQQRINETLRVLGMTTKTVTTAAVKPPVPSLPPPSNGGTVKPSIPPPVIGTKPIPDTTTAGLPPGSIEIAGTGGYKSWRAPNGDIYDQVACLAAPCYPQKRQAVTAVVKPSVTPVTVIAPPVPAQPPPIDTLPVVDTTTTTTPITEGFDFGKLLKPPLLYVVIGAAALLLLGKK